MSRVPAVWTDDCQGKKDFDGSFVEVSSRYWPRGGSSYIIERQGGKVVGTTDRFSPERQHIKPSAVSSISLRIAPMDGMDPEYPDSADSITLVEQEFEGETEEDVKAQVEAWVAEQYQIVRVAVERAFGRTPA